jgi:FK506-binding nuclear protein
MKTLWCEPEVSASAPAFITPPADLVLQNVALIHEESSDEAKGKGGKNAAREAWLSLTIGGQRGDAYQEETVSVCAVGSGASSSNLSPQVSGLGIHLNAGERVQFSVVGNGSVSLMGFFLTESAADFFDDDEVSSSSGDSEVVGDESSDSSDDKGVSADAMRKWEAFDDGAYGDESIDSDDAGAVPQQQQQRNKNKKRRASVGGNGDDDVEEPVAKRSRPANDEPLEPVPEAMSHKARRKMRQEAEKAKKAAAGQQQQHQQQQQQERPASANAKKAAAPKKPSPKKPSPKKPASESASEPVNTKRLPGGLLVQDVRLGNGPTIKAGHTAGVKYIGKLGSGKVFDSSLSKPFKFRFGLGQVIQGWDKGLRGMKVGGKRRLVIPPSMGYGNEAVPGIPRNSVLEFDVELVSS